MNESHFPKPHPMPLLDYFAGLAMQGLVHGVLLDNDREKVLMDEGLAVSDFMAFLATMSYNVAEAMIAESKKRRGK